MAIKIPGVPAKIRKLLFSLPPKTNGDDTPPEPGEVLPRQTGVCVLTLEFPNFLDTETDIITSRILVGSSSGKGNYHDESLPDNPAQWAGELMECPPSGQVVHVCVQATNSASRKTTACSIQPLIWDSVGPAAHTWMWHSGRQEYVVGATYTNSSSFVSFILSVSDVPAAAWTGVATVSWAVFSERHATPPEAATFRVLTTEQMSTVALTEGLTAEEAATCCWVRVRGALETPMLHASTNYLHVYSCDALNNCAMHISGAIRVDLTPPVAPHPATIVPNAESLYPPPATEPRTPGVGPGVVWISADHISPAWNDGTYVELGIRGRNPVCAPHPPCPLLSQVNLFFLYHECAQVMEPESSPVENTWRVFGCATEQTREPQP